MVISGFANSEGTARYRDRFRDLAAEGHFRNEQGLTLSSIGIGTYLGNADGETDQRYMQTVIAAVRMGANVIDTAINYRFQRSELSVGQALRVLTETEGFSRDELVICTKGGYIPFELRPQRDVRRYIEETFVQPGIAGFDDFVGGSHCMTPAYLANQLEVSLSNLGLDCIDVYYIHNPEAQLGSVPRDEFDSRLRAAFEMLEGEVTAGRIRRYGVATWNGFRADPSARNYHSLENMVTIAREISGENHNFRAIQLPFNFAMTEALLNRNQMLNGTYVTVLEAASAFGITVFASASILQGKIAVGLSDEVREPLGSLPTDAQTGIQFVRSTPGITTALVGMSRVEHAEENLALVGVPPAPAGEYAKLFAR
jgi:aryl-alcohol dehydrogenase-like predicted oxidoreductase